MNEAWSERNKTMQTQIKKKDTYEAGIDTLFDLRNELMKTLLSFHEELSREDFDAIPFINADGYHCKTIAYFSRQLNLKEIYSYISEVKDSTEKIINRFAYEELKKKISEERKEHLKLLNVVSDDGNAIWLIEYWCGKLKAV